VINSDKAYIMGLMIGGGFWDDTTDVIRIRLPFKQWGSYTQNPERAGLISQDILRVVSPMFKSLYDINISYTTSMSGEWTILCEGDFTSLRKDLNDCGITGSGELRKNSDLNVIIPQLIDDNLKRRFIAGLADTIGSTKPTHRRFNNDKQILSFEISGFNFDFVCTLCNLLHNIECYPDQILWNHPNFHCASNPYDSKWKKGFKLRVLLDQYHKFGAFAFSSKAKSSSQNRELENAPSSALPCEEKPIHATPSCVHLDENNSLLPDSIRGGHYIHNRHVCAVLKCEHAPYSKIAALLSNAEDYVNPFPILVKGSIENIKSIIDRDPLTKNRVYTDFLMEIDALYQTYLLKSNTKMFGKADVAGYPLNQIIHAVTYLIAASTGELNGSRPRGNLKTIILNYLKQHQKAEVKISLPDILTPLVITMGENATLVGASNPQVYKKLITTHPENPYKLYVRKIEEADLK
jgi:hypothetical protein